MVDASSWVLWSHVSAPREVLIEGGRTSHDYVACSSVLSARKVMWKV
jgi:hypothetical protein